jgi:hypothetical protein
VFTLLVACASVEPVRVDDFNSPQGIPYYEGSYYLLVWPDGLGNLKWSLNYVADTTKKMEYRTKNFLSAVETDLEFSNGLLTKGTTSLDSTAVPKAVVAAAEKVLLAAIANDASPTNSNAIPGPSIFKLVVNGGKIVFLGEESKDVVYSTITTPKKEKEKEGSK